MRDPERFPPIKPEHAQAIGYVAANWSMIEEQLGFIIYNLLRLHAIPGMALTAELGTLPRLSIVGALINLTGNAKWMDEWQEVAKTLDDLRNQRNDAVHSAWQFRGLQHRRTRIKAKGQLTIKDGPVPTDDLTKLSDEIVVLIDRIDVLIAALIKGSAGKIINQFHPPGWIVPTQTPNPSPNTPSQTRNPKRARQQVSRKQRREAAMKKCQK